MLFQFFGGLGIFLFGIKYMGDGLQHAAGDRLREILDKFTTNPLMGVLAGMLVTILIQSSSGTTVLTVGLVSAGFMTLRQAIGVVMGANIGTTVTAFIIGVDLGEYALPIIALGAVALFFFKNKKIQSVGQILFGFGCLFFGLELMGDGMKPLRTLEAFHDLTLSMSQSPVLGVLVGTLFTVIVQSSSATVGILQELYAQGAMDLKAALPVLFGDNIGTTITAVLASIGASVAARRTALVHVMFNVIGTTIFLFFLGLYTPFIDYLKDVMNLDEKMTIAFAHGIFNFTNTIIQFPFIAALAWAVMKLIPGDDHVIDYKPQNLNPIFIERSPSIALERAKEEVIRMAEFSIKCLEETQKFLNTKQNKHAEMALQIEDAINNLDKKITAYLIEISEKPLSDTESKQHLMLMDTVRDIERIGDYSENIIELIEYQQTYKVTYSDVALGELNEMLALTISTIQDATVSLSNFDLELANKVMKKEDQIDKMERVLRKRHILRVNNRECSGESGIIFVDIVSILERIGDHGVNIAEAVIAIETES